MLLVDLMSKIPQILKVLTHYIEMYNRKCITEGMMKTYTQILTLPQQPPWPLYNPRFSNETRSLHPISIYHINPRCHRSESSENFRQSGQILNQKPIAGAEQGIRAFDRQTVPKYVTCSVVGAPRVPDGTYDIK